jgi:tripeptidyl-peptidase-1
LILLACLVAVCLANNLGDWYIKERSTPEESFKFTVALKLKNTNKFEKLVLDISDPNSPNYSNWMTAEQVLDIVAPNAHVSTQIMRWFSAQCSDFQFVNNRDHIIVTGPARCAEKALNVRLMRYVHKPTGHSVLRRHIEDLHPLLPPHLQRHISFLTCVSALPKIRKTVKSENPQAYAAYNFNIPSTMRSLYNIPTGTRGTNPKNSQSVMEFSPVGGPLFTDLQTFASQAGEVFNNISRIVGPYYQGSEAGESTLDVDYISTVGAGISTYYITIADGWIYDMAATLFTLSNPPLVVSVSYGWMEAQTCETDVTNANCTGIDAQTYVARANLELAKVAALGISVIVASQDEGAPSDNNEDCSLDSSYPLWPIYPASSNWVTTVSSTSYATNDGNTYTTPAICSQGYPCSKGPGQEVFTMANNTYYVWTGGSGFANYTAMPAWQKTQAQQWLNPGYPKTWPIPPTVFFNPANRAYPDVVALGDRILIICDGAVSVTAGTSASTPIFSGIISLLNDARLNAGKKPLGFLAPLLYTMSTASPASFHDITVGTSSWSRASYSCKYGYGCSVGWDPASGLGSLDYTNALKYVLSLP